MSTWIYRIALNTAISFYRYDKKVNERQVPIHESIISLAENKHEDELDENISKLYQFIDGLEKFDKALMLLYLDNKKYKEISSIMGISETYVSTKINRIKKSLKQKFDKNL